MSFLWCSDRCLRLMEQCIIVPWRAIWRPFLKGSLWKGLLVHQKEWIHPNSVSDIDIQEPVKDATAQIKVAIGDAVVSYSQLTIQMTLKLVKTCVHVADLFITVVLVKYSDSDDLRLIFDRYNVPLSLKMATLVSRQGGHQPDSHYITDGTCAGFCFLQTQNCIFFFS